MEPTTAVTSLLIVNKFFGKTAEVLADDIKAVYKASDIREKMLRAATRKAALDDNGDVNIRVAREVLLNGSYAEGQICSEYFGGVLASARSDGGADDSSIYYLSVVQSLSSSQLKIHYQLYNCLNKLLNSDTISTINLDFDENINRLMVWVNESEFTSVDLYRDMEVLHRRGLIEVHRAGFVRGKANESIPAMFFCPTALGIQTYAVGHGLLNDWRKFQTVNFGDFPEIETLKHYSFKDPTQ
jgi:hypothetical protein